MGNESVQVVKLVLSLLWALWYFFCPDSNLKPIIHCRFIGLEFLEAYSQQKFMEDSEIYKVQYKTFKPFLEFFAMCTYGIISLYKFNDKATGV